MLLDLRQDGQLVCCVYGDGERVGVVRLGLTVVASLNAEEHLVCLLPSAPMSTNSADVNRTGRLVELVWQSWSISAVESWWEEANFARQNRLPTLTRRSLPRSRLEVLRKKNFLSKKNKKLFFLFHSL